MDKHIILATLTLITACTSPQPIEAQRPFQERVECAVNPCDTACLAFGKCNESK